MAIRSKKDVSFVIPVYNEEKNLQVLYRELIAAGDALRGSYEIIFVDDGSSDGSFPALREIQAGDPRVKIIRLRKNFGQTAALSAGFDHARGGIIITLDADLQNDPADAPLLVAKIDEGYDIVCGWRIKRKDKFVSRRLPSKIANWIISRVTKVKLHDYGCTLKAFRGELIKHIKLYGEMHRFIPAIASTMGTAIAEVPVNHRPRLHGKSKYNLSKSIRVVLDLLTVKFLLSYSTRPLQIFGLFGLVAGFIGGLMGGILSYQRLVLKQSIANRPLLLLSVLLIVIGIQFITMGLLGEIMVRTYHESVEKPIYVVRDVIDSDSDEKA
ncbi:MAG: glycosyltransferase family 2 protein [Candidatus Aminicenantes bacterium]|nr:glycosyltransferase family 2 protein [Candidatus Aminicenantes bacterium]